MSNPLNITTAAFGGLREVTTSPLWQWDYGQILKITGLDLPQAFEVHFSNSRKSGETVTQIGTDSQVVIPDMYLTSGADIYAFIFLHDGLTDGETEYVIKIPVRERPEPSDIEPTPEQQDAITEAIAALNNAVNKADVAITHYPQVIEGVWHVWDVTTEAYVSTGIKAQGNGIASAVLNADYTLTLTFTDGTTYTTPSIRGAQGVQGEKGDKGEGAVNVFLRDPVTLIPTDADGYHANQQIVSTYVYAFKDGEPCAITSVTATPVSILLDSTHIQAVDAVITVSGTSALVKYTLPAGTGLRNDRQIPTITAVIDGESYVNAMCIASARQGAPGDDYTLTAADKRDIAEQVSDMHISHRITSLTTTKLVCGETIEAVGIPVYVSASDISQYAAYNITETGWYIFARITAPDGVTVTQETAIAGAAGYIALTGAAYVDVAVHFEVAAESQAVTIDWGDTEEVFIFKATDLAVRNLDYRTTFYVYDLAPFVTWTYVLATGTFAANTKYYTLADGVYTEAEVTVGETIPADTYYKHSKVRFEGMARNVTYKLDEMIDCPIEIALPEVANDGHGAWFEFQLRYNAEYSCTLVPPTNDVKAGTAQTQKQTAGINVVDLHYTEVNGAKIWTLINTHSNIPT